MDRTLNLSAIDQVCYRGYINLLFCFQTTASDTVISHLREGSASFASAHPIIAGRVRPKLGAPGRVEISYNSQDARPPFFDEDLCEKLPSYSRLHTSGFIIHGPKYECLSL